MTMEWILLILVLSLSTANCIAPIHLNQRRSGRDLQNGDKVEAFYRIGMSMFGSFCRFPASVTFVIECGDTAVALDDDENLGQAKCESIDKQTLQCTDNSLNSFLGFPAEVVMKCVGDTENDVQVAVVLSEDTVDCSGDDSASPRRSLYVTRICVEQAGGPVVELVPTNRNCVNSVKNVDFNSCENRVACNGFAQCASMILPAVGVDFSGTAIPFGCLFGSEPPPPLPALSDIGSGNSAEYSVTFNIRDGGLCVVDYPVEVTFSCGDEEHEGRINFLPESQAALDSGVCQPAEGTSKIVCKIDPSPEELPLNLEAKILAACTGTSVEALAISVEMEPGKMSCFSMGSDSIFLSVAILQFCTGVKSNPLGEFGDVFAQDCSPLSVEQDASAFLDLSGDGIQDTFIPRELCTYHQGNCFDDFFCEADGSQELGNIRSTIPGYKVDLECLVTRPLDLPPTTTDPTCVDNSKKKNIFFGIPINGKERDCAWLSNTSKKVKKWYCQNDKRAQQRCAACGKAMEDANPPSTIDAYKVQKRNCAWLEARNDISELCKLSKDARKACKKTCGRCG